MNIRKAYIRYRARKTLRKKMAEASRYIRPGYNTLNALHECARLLAEISELKQVIKK